MTQASAAMIVRAHSGRMPMTGFIFEDDGDRKIRAIKSAPKQPKNKTH
jgi:hypothetical protein